MDKLADGLQKLNEDDLLQVVQMVHDNKAPDSYTKNDMECKSLFPSNSYFPLTRFFFQEILILYLVGEFHVDLYTLPDSLIKMLWDFASDRHVI